METTTNQQQHHHHHHHHHHSMDSASRFKRDSLNSIRRRKLIEKWLWRGMVCLAILMAIAVVVAYTIG
jgi:G3E family GTPase